MHYRVAPDAEAKLVRVVRGAIHDVVLDLRRDSATFGKWFAAELSADNRRALYIPEGCAHGYLTLADDTELFYLHNASYRPNSEAGVHWNIPELEGAWPFDPSVVSERDQRLPRKLP
jgi:dTDP-4-dehydrorhamnose 3,5-epimerase